MLCYYQSKNGLFQNNVMHPKCNVQLCDAFASDETKSALTIVFPNLNFKYVTETLENLYACKQHI